MNNPPPYLIGITGGIGAGKSTVARIFSILEIPTYYADDRAKWLMANNEQLKIQIITIFGKESYTEDGSLNRAFLADKIFNDPDNTEIINQLVHPAVKEDFIIWSRKQDKNTPYVLKEAALLFETGSYKDLHKTIHVSSPLKIRIARILNRDPHRTLAQINEIINRQLPDEEKNKLADFIIKNTDNRLVVPQVLKIHEELLRLNSSDKAIT